MRSQADALVDATNGLWWPAILAFVICAGLLSGCANSASIAGYAAAKVGANIAVPERILEGQEMTEPGSVHWSLNRRYVLDGNLRVFPYPPEWGCSTEFIVNSADIIVGFNLVGDCTFYKHPAPW